MRCAIPWLACIGALLQSLAPAAFAQTAERPVLKPGDRWRFVVYYAVPATEPNREWVIDSVSPEAIRGTEDGQPLLMTPDLNVLDSPRAQYSNPRWLQFPLAVGKRWNSRTDWWFKPKGSRGRSDVEVQVLAYEPVTVVAGRFDAFKLVAKSRMSGTSPIGSTYDGTVATTTYWYAPAARAVVRWEFENPYLGRSTVEMVSAP